MQRKRPTWCFCRGTLTTGRAAAPGKSVRVGADFRVRLRLHELQRHPIALPDGLILGAVDVAECVRGRESPNAFRMICRVPRIRVDLRLGHEAKTCLLDLGDDPVFTQVASCTRRYRVCLRAMIHQAKEGMPPGFKTANTLASTSCSLWSPTPN